MYPTNRYYSKDHEWVEPDEDVCRVGITEFAQEELGDVVFVELPQVGQSFGAGDEIGTIESVKAVAEIYSPVAGEVIEINEKIVDAPELINEDPHNEGWIVRLKMAAPAELSELMGAEQYEAFLAASGES